LVPKLCLKAIGGAQCARRAVRNARRWRLRRRRASVRRPARRAQARNIFSDARSSSPAQPAIRRLRRPRRRALRIGEGSRAARPTWASPPCAARARGGLDPKDSRTTVTSTALSLDSCPRATYLWWTSIRKVDPNNLYINGRTAFFPARQNMRRSDLERSVASMIESVPEVMPPRNSVFREVYRS